MRNAQFSISNYLIGIVVFTLIIMGGLGIISSFRAADSTLMSDAELGDFNTTFNNYETLNTNINNLQTSVTNSTPNIGVYGVLDGLINSAWGTFKFIFTGFGFMNSAFYGLSAYIGLPTWVGQLLISIVIILLVFAVYRLLFGTGEA